MHTVLNLKISCSNRTSYSFYFQFLFLFVYNKEPNITNRQKNFLLNFLLFFVD